MQENSNTKTLIIDCSLLRPFQPGEPIGCCSQCDKNQARWTLVDPTEDMAPDGQPIRHIVCALCFLYESRWGTARRERLDAMIKSVEAAKNTAFLRDATGKLLSPQDADRILAGIALTSRMMSLGMMGGQVVDESDEDADEGEVPAA